MFKRDSFGALRFDYSDEAKMFKSNNTSRCLQPSVVRERAVKAVLQQGGDTEDALAILGQHTIQWGRFRSKTFKWMIENGLGYCGWFVDSMRNEKATEEPLSVNKHAFKAYVTSYPEGREAVSLKARGRMAKANKTKVSPKKEATVTGGICVSSRQCINQSELLVCFILLGFTFTQPLLVKISILIFAYNQF